MFNYIQLTFYTHNILLSVIIQYKLHCDLVEKLCFKVCIMHYLLFVIYYLIYYIIIMSR